jgi:hypothetical protein
MTKTELRPGDVVQISPDCPNRPFAGCMMTVTEPKAWGAQGYVQALGEDEQPGGQAFIRIKWEDMEFVGRAPWVAGSIVEDLGRETEA